MANKITTAVAVEGEQQYREAIKACASELSTLKSDLIATESEFRNNANSMEALSAKGEVLAEMFDVQQQKVAAAAEALQAAQEAQEKYGSTIAQMQSDLDAAQAALSELTAAGKENSEEANELRAAISNLNADLSTQQQYYDAATKGVNSWTKELNYSSVKLRDMADEIADNNEKMESFKGASDGVADTLEDIGDAADKGASGSDLFASAFGNIAATFTAVGILELLKSAAEAVYDFAVEVQNAEAIIVKGTGAIGTALDDLSENMMNVYAAVDNGDLNEVATAIADVNTRLKLTGGELEEVSRLMLEFADVTGSSASEAVENVSKIMKNWNIDIADTEKLLDKLVAASQGSGMAVGELASNMLRYRATFSELGYSLDETIAILANLEDAGLNTSQVMTGLQTAVRNLAKDGGDVGRALRDAISEIESMGDTSEATARAVEIFGSRAGVELADAIKNGRISIEEWLTVLENSEGVMQSSADAADTFEDKMTQAMNGVKTAAYNMAESVENDLGRAFKEMTQAATSETMSEISREMKVVEETSRATAQYAGELAQKLADLAEGGLETAESQEEYARTIETLNGLIPGLNLAIDSQTGVVDQNTASILENIAAWKESVEVQATGAYRDAALEDYGAKLTELEKARKELTDAEVEATQLQARSDAMYKMLAETIGVTEESAESFYGLLSQAASVDPEVAALAEEYYELQDALETAQEKVDTYSEAVDICTEATDAAKQALEDAEAAFQAAADASGEVTEAETEQAAAVGALQEAYSGYTSRIKEQLANLNEALEENKAAYAEAHAAAVESFEGIFGVMDQAPDVMSQSASQIQQSLTDLNSALDSQAKYWEDYAANIQTAMERGVNEGLVKTLADGTEEGAQLLASLAQASDEEIKAINQSFEEMQKAQENAATEYVNATTTLDEANAEITKKMEELAAALDVADDAYTAGINTIMGFADGAASSTEDVARTYESIAEAAVEAFTQTLRAGLQEALDEAEGQVSGAVSGYSSSGGGGMRTGNTTVNTNIYTSTMTESQVDYVVKTVNKQIGNMVGF